MSLHISDDYGRARCGPLRPSTAVMSPLDVQILRCTSLDCHDRQHKLHLRRQGLSCYCRSERRSAFAQPSFAQPEIASASNA